MKGVWFKVEFGYLRRGYFNSGGVHSLRQFCLDLQPRGGPGVGNQMDDGSIADQRSCPPILCDERKHPVFDLIPRAGSRSKVRYLQVEAGEIYQIL